MRIINQIEINEYTVIEVSDQTCFGGDTVYKTERTSNKETSEQRKLQLPVHRRRDHVAYA